MKAVERQERSEKAFFLYEVFVVYIFHWRENMSREKILEILRKHKEDLRKNTV